MSSRYTEQMNENFKVKFPELYARFEAAQSRQEVFSVARKTRNEFYDDKLSFACCDGAINCFKEFCAAKFEVMVTRSAADARADRILHITNSDGRRQGRRMC